MLADLTKFTPKRGRNMSTSVPGTIIHRLLPIHVVDGVVVFVVVVRVIRTGTAIIRAATRVHARLVPPRRHLIKMDVESTSLRTSP